MTTVLPVRFGSNPPVKEGDGTTPQLPLVPAETPPDTFVLGYQSTGHLDVAVDHQHRNVNGTFTNTPVPTTTTSDAGDTVTVTPPQSQTHSNGLSVAVRVNGPSTSDLNVVGRRDPQGVTGRGNLTVHLGEQSPFVASVGVVEDTEELHGADREHPARQVTTSNQVNVKLHDLTDHTAATITPNSFTGELKTQLKSGTIVYVNQGQSNGLQEQVQNNPPGEGGLVVITDDDDDSDAVPGDPTPLSAQAQIRERTGTKRTVTVLLGEAATVPVVKKDEGDKDPTPQPQPLPIGVTYKVDGTRVLQPASSEVNGTVHGQIVAPFRVTTQRNVITYTNPEHTEAEVDETEASASSTTSGHVKLDGKSTLRLVLPRPVVTPTPPADGQEGQAGTTPVPPTPVNPAAVFNAVPGPVGTLLRGLFAAVRHALTPPPHDPPAQQPGAVTDTHETP